MKTTKKVLKEDKKSKASVKKKPNSSQGKVKESKSQKFVDLVKVSKKSGKKEPPKKEKSKPDTSKSKKTEKNRRFHKLDTVEYQTFRSSVAKTEKVPEKELVTMERRGAPQEQEAENSPHTKRAKVTRRRQIDPTTCERDYTPEEVEFMGALDLYKRQSGRMFPTCSEILEVIKGLGYIKQSHCEVTEVLIDLDTSDVTVTSMETMEAERPRHAIVYTPPFE